MDGHESYYNIAMMNEIHSIFGIGAGATTKITDIDTNGKIGHFENYKYPHEYGGYVKQQYMPDSLKDRVYYTPSQNGKEKSIIRKKFRGEK